MDADVKTQWLAALRGGQYSQAQGVLHNADEGGFCCLGVLCHVLGAKFGEAQEQDNEDEWIHHDYVPVLNGCVIGKDEELTASFAKEIGIPDQYELMELNDGNTDLWSSPAFVLRNR